MSTEALSDVTRVDLQRLKAQSAVRWLSALATNNGEQTGAREEFRRRWPMDVCAHAVATKADVGAGASGLFSTPPTIAQAFVDAVQPFAILSRLGLRRVPFRTPISHGAPAATFCWVSEAKPKPSAALVYTPGEALAPLKAAGLLVVTAELLKLSTRSEAVLLGDLRRAYVAWLDAQFVDPTNAAVVGENPGSVTAGLSAVASAGSTPDDAIEDLRQLHATYVAGGGRVETAVLLISSANAVALHLADPQRFGTLTRDGGTLGGLPVVASDGVGYQLVLLDASNVLLADDGDADLSIATHAAVEMNDDPTQDGSAGTGVTGASLVSLWQNNLAGVRIERMINWRAGSGAVARVSGAAYYAAGSPLA